MCIMKTWLPALGIHSSLSSPSWSRSSPTIVPWNKNLHSQTRMKRQPLTYQTTHKSPWSCAKPSTASRPAAFSVTPFCIYTCMSPLEKGFHRDMLLLVGCFGKLFSTQLRQQQTPQHFFPQHIIITQIELASKHPTKLSIKQGWEHHPHWKFYPSVKNRIAIYI